MILRLDNDVGLGQRSLRLSVHSPLVKTTLDAHDPDLYNI